MQKNSPPQNGDLNPQAILIHGDAALAKIIGCAVPTIRRWRALRLIPFLRTGHKSISYALPRVLAALERLETRAHSESKH